MGGNPTPTQFAKLEFNSQFKESIMRGPRLTLGAGGLEVLLKRLDIETPVSQPAQLHTMLASIFQEPGASVLEREIVRRLYGLVGERFVETPGSTFESYVEEARKADEQVPRRVN